MNIRETGRILSYITAIYPGFLKDRDPKILTEVWQRVFAAVPYTDVERALSAFIATDVKGFPPTPGAVNALLVKSAQLYEPTEDQAWMRLLRAISRGLYNSGEEFSKLPKEIREIVGSPRQLYEWAQLDASEVNTVIASSFKRSWRVRQELKRELGPLLPPSESGWPALP